MDYMGLTEEELLDVVVAAEGNMEAERTKYEGRLRDLGLRAEEVAKRMRHFEATYLIRKLIAENNRRLGESLEGEFDLRKRELFI